MATPLDKFEELRRETTKVFDDLSRTYLTLHTWEGMQEEYKKLRIIYEHYLELENTLKGFIEFLGVARHKSKDLDELRNETVKHFSGQEILTKISNIHPFYKNPTRLYLFKLEEYLTKIERAIKQLEKELKEFEKFEIRTEHMVKGIRTLLGKASMFIEKTEHMKV